MLGLLKPKLPVTSEQQRWVDRSFLRLGKLLGAQRLLEATVVLPTPEHFPDPYDGSEAALRKMFERVATRMDVSPDQVDVGLFACEKDVTRSLVPCGLLTGQEPADKSRRSGPAET